MVVIVICLILIILLLILDIGDNLLRIYHLHKKPEPKEENRIEISLGNGRKLIAERDPLTEFDREIFIGIEQDGCWIQDLAIVRNRYEYLDSGEMRWVPGEFQVLVYSNEYEEDYTNEFIIKEYYEN